MKMLYIAVFSVFCPAGSELVGNECIECPITQFKSNTPEPSRFSMCVDCPAGFVAPEEGATSSAECSIRKLCIYIIISML